MAEQEYYPGQVWVAKAHYVEKAQVTTLSLQVRNTGDRPIQVGSHYHFFEVNKFLEFDREKAWGMRLAIPSGTAHRFEAGMEYTVEIIPYEGERIVFGFNGLASGSLDDENVKAQALAMASEKGFKGVL